MIDRDGSGIGRKGAVNELLRLCESMNHWVSSYDVTSRNYCVDCHPA